MQANASFSFPGVPLLARTYSYALSGLDPVRVDVEVDVAQGLPGLTIVGLPDQAVREARERVRSALVNSHFRVPNSRLTVNLAPADLKKEGGVFDLPIALGILAASAQVDPEALTRVASLGELALDGTLRPVAGVLPISRALRRKPITLLVPAGNAGEAAAAEGIRALAVGSLADAVAWLRGQLPLAPLTFDESNWVRVDGSADGDFSDVKGQVFAKRGLEIAAAGQHHVLLVGPAGSGKSMLASRLVTILPDLSVEEALESATIQSVAGLLTNRPRLQLRRPFRAPHHTCSAIALIGGGPVPRPGEASLAHHGILFLDELPEFHRDVLETLRQPLEEGVISVARARCSMAFPARFMLIAAMNPCFCGRLMESGRCRCSSTQVQRYLSKVSGPLLDRIDLHIEVPAQPYETLTNGPNAESSAAIRARVQCAIAWRQRRGQQLPNAQLSAKELKVHCQLSADAIKLLRTAMQELELSARSYTKILKIARTIADLANRDTIHPDDVAEAIQYRSLDRQLWA